MGKDLDQLRRSDGYEAGYRAGMRDGIAAAAAALQDLAAELSGAAPKWEGSAADVHEWLGARTERRPGAKVRAAALYRSYESWARAAGKGLVSQTLFGRTLSALGFERDIAGVVWWKGLAISQVETGAGEGR